MLTTPTIQQRAQQPYVAIRTTVAMRDIPTVLPPLIPEVEEWVKKNKLQQTGPAFFQYRYMSPDQQLVTEVGVPVAEPAKGDGRVIAGIFPEGNYASITYYGHYMNIREAHSTLDKWAKEQGLKEKVTATHDGVEWGGRIEMYVTDPAEIPDPAKWQTDIMYLVEG